MAKTATSRNGQSETGHKAYWLKPWVQRVMQGNYSKFEKLVFMRIASFGADGCWMKNETFMVEFSSSERPIRRAITALQKGGEFWITGWNSSRRRIYATHNPEVKAMAETRYKAELKAGKVTDKADFYRKTKTRGYTTPQKAAGLDKNNPAKNDRVKQATRPKMTGIPAKNDRVGGQNRPGYPAKNDRVHISKSRERT